MKPLNIIFAGTPAFGLPCLEAIAASEHHLNAVFCQPDRPAGRGRKEQAPPIKSWAVERQIPVFQPESLKTAEVQRLLKELQPDLMVVIAYGLILPKEILSIPTFGCINVHASLLPRWRGASPIQQAILHGDEESGVCIMKMAEGMDDGDVISCQRCPISPEDTATSLHDKLSVLAVEPLLNSLNHLEQALEQAQAQDATMVTYAPKISKAQAKIDWQQPAVIIARQVNAFNPWPIAFTDIHDTRVRIHQARAISISATALPGTVIEITKQQILVAAGEGALAIERLQFPGGKVISVADWINAGQAFFKLHSIFQ